MDSSLFFNYLKRNNESPQLSWEQHAQQLGIEVNQAFQFHNSYCDDANKCMSLKDIPSCYFSPKGLDLEILKRNHPSKAEINEQLQFNPLSWNGLFRVLEHDDSHSLKYSVKINVKNEGSEYLMQYSAHDFFFNNEAEQGKMAFVALKCMESIEPIVLRCGANFSNMRLENHGEIVEKWKSSSCKLKEICTDEYAGKYFNQFEKNINNLQYFFERFTRQLPIQLLFQLPFSKEQSKMKLNTIHSFIPVEHQIIEFNQQDKYQFKTIRINGIAIDERSFEHIYFNLDVPIADGRLFKGKFSYELDFDPSTSFVQGLQFTNVTIVDHEEMNHSIIAYRIGND